MNFSRVEAKRQKAERAARFLIRLGHWAALTVAAISVIILVAWWFGLTWAGEVTSTSLVSAAGLFLIGAIGVALVRPFQVPESAVVLLATVQALATACLAAEFLGSPAAPIGWPDAVLLMFVSSSFLIRARGYPRLSQLAAILGLAPALVSFTGYAYGVDHLHGPMTVTTTVLGLIFASTPLMLGARTGFMRALCSPWNGGRYGRIQIASIAGLLFMGGLLLETDSRHISSHLAVAVIGAILLLTLVSGYSAIAIERSDYARRAAERVVARLVLHDPLTGLYNRRFLKEQAGSIVAFAQRQGLPLSVLMIDIDHFKKINDAYGHQVGDVVLQRVADAIKMRLRRGDLAVRYGGEELLVVLPGASVGDACEIAEQLRTVVSRIELTDIGGSRATISVGVAAVDTTLQQAMSAADAALYKAKNTGRNRVVCANPPRPHVRLAAG